MTYWYSKSLGDGMWANGAAEEIVALFQPLSLIHI